MSKNIYWHPDVILINYFIAITNLCITTRAKTLKDEGSEEYEPQDK